MANRSKRMMALGLLLAAFCGALLTGCGSKDQGDPKTMQAELKKVRAQKGD